jgi:hypothetical protein
MVYVRVLALRAVTLGRAWTLFGSKKTRSQPVLVIFQGKMLDVKRAAREVLQRPVPAVLGSIYGKALL